MRSNDLFAPRWILGVARAEAVAASVALVGLLVGEIIMSETIRGTHFAAGDGRMAEAIVRATFRLAAPFHVTNLNHIQGVGSLLLPFNVWANPAYWPFAILEGDRAAEVSGLIALAGFAIAVYAMARCFDLPRTPSALAAQSCIVLFGPLVLLASGTTVFAQQPGFAVVYAPLMVALGVLARVDPGRLGPFLLRTSFILLLLLYSVYSDPLWSIIGGISWSAAFMIVAFSPLRWRPILVRCASLGCCGVVLLASGVLEYLYTLPRYTARLEFAGLLVRPANVIYASVLFTSEYAKYWYGACIFGWTLGLLSVRGRPRVLVTAGLGSFGCLFAYATAFLILQPDWPLPLPIYIEQCIWPLFTAGGVAGYWGALRPLGVFANTAIDRGHLLNLTSWPQAGASAQRQSRWCAVVSTTAKLAILIAVPGNGIWAAFANQHLATSWVLRWPEEAELGNFLSMKIGAQVGESFRGSAIFPQPEYFDLLSMSNLWKHSIPTANEYSQLVSPQMIYLNAALFKKDVAGDLNHFSPWVGTGATFGTLSKTLQALGVRYLVTYARIPEADKGLMSAGTFPRRQPRGPHGAYQLDRWEVYEFPAPNVGNYSPTHIVAKDSAAEIIAQLNAANFDFRRDVVVTGLSEALVPAREARLFISRRGLHFSGESSGNSLVLLPQQFSNCLTASDKNVRIVRANLTSAALLFSGKVETDISLGYGLFSPACRRADLADLNRLNIMLPGHDLNAEHSWKDVTKRVKAALAAIK